MRRSARGLAEAEAIKARGDALEQHADAVIGQQLADRWPEIVEAAAKPFGAIDQLIVLNGAEGLSATLAQALSQGVAGLGMARKLLGGAADPQPSTPHEAAVPTVPVPAHHAPANGRLTGVEPG